MDTIGKRLKEVLRRMMYTQRRFAEETGIPETNLSNVIHDKAVLSLSMKEKIAAKFPNINLEWVELGPGHGQPLNVQETKETLHPFRFWDEVLINVLKELAGKGVSPEKAASEAGKYADAAVKVRQQSLLKP